MDVFDALAHARGAGRRVVLVTVLAVGGDAPSHAGAKLVVDVAGDIVAGNLGCSEFNTAGVAFAAEAATAGVPQRRRLTFGAGDASGAAPRELELFAEVHEPEPAVLVLGANPVARAIASIAHTAGRRVVVIAPGGDTAMPAGIEVKADDPARLLLAAPPGLTDALVLSDHDAPYVDEVLRIGLASEAFFVGMLGSRRHAPQAVARLREQGVPEAHLQRLRSPCGLDIGSRSAEEIGLSIVAEIVAVERGRTGGSMGMDWAASER